MVNNYAVFNMSLVEEQTKSTFTQLGKTQDLQVKVSQGMRESKRSGKNIVLAKGTTLVTTKSVQCKEIIKKHALDFGAHSVVQRL